MSQQLGNTLRHARRARHWTQAELAERIGVSQSTVSFWENGVETPALVHQIMLLELMPEILSNIESQTISLFDRVQALERQLFGGKCSCKNCSCDPVDEYIPISRALQKRSSRI